MSSNKTTDGTIGFVSVLEHEQGWLGGLLVLNAAGKPLEFHCTAPVKPTHSHLVLYGPTLRHYVLADNIAPKLIAAVKQSPAIYCTDCIEMTATVVEQAAMVFVRRADDSTIENADDSSLPGKLRTDDERRMATLDHFEVDQQPFAIDQSCASRKHEIVLLLETFADGIDLHEPFERIHNAIQQSHGIKSEQAA